MAAGIAHEIKNPLVAIKTFTQLLPRKYEDPDFKPRYMDIVPPQITRIRKLCQSLLQLGDPKAPSLQSMSLEKMLDNVQDLLNSSSKKYKGDVILDGNLDMHVLADPEQIEQVFLNLILNGLESLEESGQVVIRASELATGFIAVKIEDNGCGISKEQKEQLFDPFYTTKSSGTGLGMSIVHQIVSDHKGHIDVKSKEGKGTTFIVHLPKEKKI